MAAGEQCSRAPDAEFIRYVWLALFCQLYPAPPMGDNWPLKMADFPERLRERHKVALRGAGFRTIPSGFDSVSGFWTTGTAGKAVRALVRLTLGDNGQVVCEIPDNYDGAIRLGQLNVNSLQTPPVAAFTIMAAVPSNTGWQLVDNCSWLLAFRFAGSAIAEMIRAFGTASMSSIAFLLNSQTGELKAHTSNKDVPCEYLDAVLIKNVEGNPPLPLGQVTYDQATEAIKKSLAVEPHEAP